MVWAALLSASCGAALLKLPSGPGVAAPDAGDALAQATAACRGVRTLTAEIGVAGRLHGQKLRGRLSAGFAAPASVRLEAVAPFGAPFFIFVASNDEGTLVLPRDNRVIEHAPPTALLDAVAGVPFGPSELKEIVTGCAVVETPIVAGERFGDQWRRIQAAGDRALYLQRDGGSAAWRLVAMVSGGRDAMRLEYGDFAGAFPRTVHLFAAPGMGSAGSDYDLRLTLSQVDTNVPLGPEVFRVEIPRSARPITLEELRESGPLAASGVRRGR